MKISQAIMKAMKVFEKEQHGEIRNVLLQEGYGRDNIYSNILLRIEYAVDGDYSESDKTPYLVRVSDGLGGIIAERVIF